MSANSVLLRCPSQAHNAEYNPKRFAASHETELQKLELDFEAFVDRISAGLKSEEIHSQQHNESFSSLDHLEAELQQLNSRNHDLTQEIVKLSTLFGDLKLFGPTLFIWFCSLAGIGMYNLVKYDRSVLRAFSPIHIYYFFKWNTSKAWYSLGGCLLCATGSEAMFADLCYFSLTPAIGPHVGSVIALGNGVYEALPGFQDVSSSEKANPFIRKLNMCCVVFDSNDSNKHLKEKDIKRQTLLELINYISAVNSKFSEATMQEITKMQPDDWDLLSDDDIKAMQLDSEVLFPIVETTVENSFAEELFSDFIHGNPQHEPDSIEVKILYPYQLSNFEEVPKIMFGSERNESTCSLDQVEEDDLIKHPPSPNYIPQDDDIVVNDMFPVKDLVVSAIASLDNAEIDASVVNCQASSSISSPSINPSNLLESFPTSP
ncbi:hypothetical protein KIW84_012705 [Lathyrus oleraceus]|uniref:K+ potassium transporter integral membrane domain-containing protein n=1 Tax=Pisum sativum TaxID=3888 RepID=A0A9D5GWZ9_PEA|nr:hypothetical protein KIW84_012705 [Pisum sativum]